MIHHITFTDENMTISAIKCSESALKFGCDTSQVFMPKDYDTSFLSRNRFTLVQARGAGFWLWKPYFIIRNMDAKSDNDYIVYTDAGIQFENKITWLLNAMDGEIMLFGNRWRHGDWCKTDCLVAMGCNQEWIRDHEQLQASCVIVKNTPQAYAFMNDWLWWCQEPGLIDDTPSIKPNLPNFREHRHDQAILTNLALTNKITFHWWPAQYSIRYKYRYSDNYPVMFQHHRKRNNEW